MQETFHCKHHGLIYLLYVLIFDLSLQSVKKYVFFGLFLVVFLYVFNR